jgi:hypothetical protein
MTLAVLAALVVSPLAPAQSPAPQDRNAALKYATVFYTADADLFSKTGDIDMAKVGFDKAKVPDDFRAASDLLAKEGDAAVGALLEASRLSKCDFELAVEKGIMVTLPHLGKIRGAARLLRVDARRHLLDGDAAGAADRLAAIVRLGQHCKGDALLISSLVCLAVDNSAAEEVEMDLDAGLLDAPARRTIADVFAALPPDDPFATRAALRGEQRIFLGWARNAFHGPTAGTELAKACGLGAEGVGPSEQAAIGTLSAMTEDQVHAAMDLLSPYYDQVFAAWGSPDASTRLDKLAERVKAGEFGPMGQLFGPAVTKAHDRDEQGQKRTAAVLRRLRAN